MPMALAPCRRGCVKVKERLRVAGHNKLDGTGAQAAAGIAMEISERDHATMQAGGARAQREYWGAQMAIRIQLAARWQ